MHNSLPTTVNAVLRRSGDARAGLPVVAADDETGGAAEVLELREGGVHHPEIALVALGLAEGEPGGHHPAAVDGARVCSYVGSPFATPLCGSLRHMSATRSGTCSPPCPVWHHWKSSHDAPCQARLVECGR